MVCGVPLAPVPFPTEAVMLNYVSPLYDVQELYVLMRLHHVLCERLGKAVQLAEDAQELKNMQVNILFFFFFFG